MLQLYIGNKNYSSWSMRPWVAMRQLGIAFDEVMVRFDSFALAALMLIAMTIAVTRFRRTLD